MNNETISSVPNPTRGIAIERDDGDETAAYYYDNDLWSWISPEEVAEHFAPPTKPFTKEKATKTLNLSHRHVQPVKSFWPASTCTRREIHSI
jgi:hypothetical protein